MKDRWDLNKGKKRGAVQPEQKYRGRKGMSVLRERDRIRVP